MYSTMCLFLPPICHFLQCVSPYHVSFPIMPFLHVLPSNCGPPANVSLPSLPHFHPAHPYVFSYHVSLPTISLPTMCLSLPCVYLSHVSHLIMSLMCIPLTCNPLFYVSILLCVPPSCPYQPCASPSHVFMIIPPMSPSLSSLSKFLPCVTPCHVSLPTMWPALPCVLCPSFSVFLRRVPPYHPSLVHFFYDVHLLLP